MEVGGGGRGSVPSQTSPEHSTNHSDGRTDRQPANQEAEQLLESYPLPSRPTKTHQEETHKKVKHSSSVVANTNGQGRLPLGLRPGLSTDDQSDSETHSRGRHSDVAPGRRRGNWDTAEKPAGTDTSRPRCNTTTTQPEETIRLRHQQLEKHLKEGEEEEEAGLLMVDRPRINK